MHGASFLRRWQFSIRELLMLTAIVALLLTIWRLVDVSTFQGTAFLSSFDPMKEIQAVGEELGYVGTGGAGGGGGSSNDQHGIRTFQYGLQVPADAEPALLLGALQSKILQRLVEAECELTGDGGTSSAEGFSLVYRQGATIGLVKVDSYLQDGEFNACVLIHEFLDH